MVAEKVSVIQEVNDAIKQYVEGSSLIYGLVTEKSHQDVIVNTVGDEVVKIDDAYDNVFLHKLTGTPNYDKLRFNYRKTSLIELCCYVESACTFEVLENMFVTLQMGGALLELKGNNQSALDVLRRGFLIDDPTKNTGFNQKKYIFSFTYEIYTYVSEICCE
jgi:hypothetical protein